MDSLKPKKSIFVSRNSPIAFVVGVAGFIGSHLAESLVAKGIQVIGVDNLSTSTTENLENLAKESLFHFINQDIAHFTGDTMLAQVDLPRLDYAFFVASNDHSVRTYTQGVHGFFKVVDDLAKQHGGIDAGKPKTALISSLDLYAKNLPTETRQLKQLEIVFSKFISENKLNGRIIRLADVYGPRMKFEGHDPLISLLYSAVTDQLQAENTTLTFSSRAIYISDAVNLIIKSVLNGSTASKIYDGALLNPLKAAELRQILLDPKWHRQQDYQLAVLPPWPTPNLEKTIDELHWSPKANLFAAFEQTLSYFKNHSMAIPTESPEPAQINAPKDFKMTPLSDEAQKLLAEERAAYENRDENDEAVEPEKTPTKKSKKSKSVGWQKVKGRLLVLVCLLVLFGGLVLPFIEIGIGGLMLRQHLQNAGQAMEQGDFNRALNETTMAKNSVNSLKQSIGWLNIIKKLNLGATQIEAAEKVVDVAQQGVVGADEAVRGAQLLYKSTKMISGEDSSDPRQVYSEASAYLRSSQQKLSEAHLQFSDPNLAAAFPPIVGQRLAGLSDRLEYYAQMVEKADAAAKLLPEITAIDDKKSYLVLLQNNLELRPTGGFIGSYAKIDFENGRIKNVKVDDIYNLDGNLKDQILPPQDIQTDLGQNYWYLRDSNWEPDFPTAARQAEFFYNKEAGERVNGVIALDLTASAALLNSVGGLNLPEYSEQVTAANLFERSITHAEADFFPGSQAKRNYLTSMQSQLFNKIFFLSNQNWPGIIQAINTSLNQKHLMIYLDDPQLFSYVTSQGWGGVMPRPDTDQAGRTNDFLAVVEANLGANKANYFLQRSYKLNTSIGKEGQIYHDLAITYTNNSPSEVFPGGKYKNRFRIYLPTGTKLNKATYGDVDITASFSAYNDYGRAVFSTPLIVDPKQTRVLELSYELPYALSFSGDQTNYRLDIIKQAGTERDPIEWQFTYPINYSVIDRSIEATPSQQELIISTNLATDRSFSVGLKK